MSIVKTSAITAGFLGAFALGVWTGPALVDRDGSQADMAAVTKDAPAESRPAATPAPRRSARPAAASSASARVVPVSAPELHTQLKPLLNQGSNMTRAAEGFKDAEQFAAVAHAARNTEVPFVLLKDRVLNKHKTLAAAISEFKPELDGMTEANRARQAARSDLARLSRS
jgi:hypothetical protein